MAYKRPTAEEKRAKEKDAARVDLQRAYHKALAVARKMGFDGPSSGKGAWTAIRAYCLANKISYPGRKAKA